MNTKLFSFDSFYLMHWRNSKGQTSSWSRLLSTFRGYKDNCFNYHEKKIFKIQALYTLKTHRSYGVFSVCNIPQHMLWIKRNYITFDDTSGEDDDQNAIEDYFKQEQSLDDKMVTNMETENVFVIQPFLKEDLQKLTTPQLQLDESIALVESLPDYKVIDHFMESSSNLKKMSIFSKAIFERLKRNISEDSSISCLFFSVEQLTLNQRIFLRKELNIKKIYDRYTLVLQIFKLRMKTKEAKLQVALAEIPYLRSNLNIQHYEVSDYQRQGYVAESRKNLLRNEFHSKEQKLQKYLRTLKRQRDGHRTSRKKASVPVIAVVGYTNTGKTSLIKALAKSEKIEAKDQLFHTLDVTAHAAAFPNRLRYVLVDTVGFLSNLPHALYDAFAATMEDMLQADLIIHVRDASHPDRFNQLRKVLTILSRLNLDKKLLENIVEVQNKIDLLPQRDAHESSTLPQVSWPKRRPISLKPGQLDLRPTVVCRASATNGTGMASLVRQLQKVLMKTTGRRRIELVVPANGEHYQWLRDHCTVEEVKGKGDYQLKIVAILTDSLWNKFMSRFDDEDWITSAHILPDDEDEDV